MKALTSLILLPVAASAAWEAVKAPINNDIFDLDFTKADAGWAAAWGAILRYDAGNWTIHKRFPGDHIVAAVSAYDEQCAWVTVHLFNREDFSMLYYYDGSSWELKQEIYDHVWSIDLTGRDEGWACSSKKVYRWDGSSWRAEGPSHPVGHFYDVKFFDRNYGFLVGEFYNHHRYVSGTWHRVSVPDGEGFLSVSIVAADNVWAGGGLLGWMIAKIGHYRGSSWTFYDFPELIQVRAISMADNAFGWAAAIDENFCGNILYRWDGSRWYRVACPVSNDYSINDVVTISRDDAWACCIAGYFLRYRSGPGVTPTSLGRIKAIFK